MGQFRWNTLYNIILITAILYMICFRELANVTVTPMPMVDSAMSVSLASGTFQTVNNVSVTVTLSPVTHRQENVSTAGIILRESK